jgi:hypothetical protein
MGRSPVAAASGSALGAEHILGAQAQGKGVAARFFIIRRN